MRRPFVIAANGSGDGPAQALRDFLVGRGAEVVTITHPLLPEHGRRHLVTEYEDGRPVRTRSHWTPLRPIASYALDPFVPLACRAPRSGSGSTRSPARAGSPSGGSAAPGRSSSGRSTSRRTASAKGRRSRALYDAVDRLACRRADARVELSAAARDARAARLASRRGDACARRPDGRLARPRADRPRGRPRTATRRLPRPPDAAPGRRRPRRGGRTSPRARIRRRAGRDRRRIRARAAQGLAAARGAADGVHFHGFVPDHRRVEELLADASIAAAPYVAERDDVHAVRGPGKLKSYLAAGLPIVLTDVPPNARELASEAGAEIVEYNAVRDRGALEAGLAITRAVARAPSASARLRARIRLAGAARGRAREARRARGLIPDGDRPRRSRSATITSDGDAPGSADRRRCRSGASRNASSTSSFIPESTTFSPRPSRRSVRTRCTRQGRSR